MPYSQQTVAALRALSGAAKQAGAEMLVGLVARRPRMAPAGSPHRTERCAGLPGSSAAGPGPTL